MPVLSDLHPVTSHATGLVLIFKLCLLKSDVFLQEEMDNAGWKLSFHSLVNSYDVVGGRAMWMWHFGT